MTEQNMKKLYEHYVNTGQTKRSEEILAIDRYSKFKNNSEEKEEEPVGETPKPKGRPKKGE